MFERVKRLYGNWVRFGKKIANFQIRVLCTIVYFIFVVPLGLIVKMSGGLPGAGWHKPEIKKTTLEDAGRQF